MNSDALIPDDFAEADLYEMMKDSEPCVCKRAIKGYKLRFVGNQVCPVCGNSGVVDIKETNTDARALFEQLCAVAAARTEDVNYQPVVQEPDLIEQTGLGSWPVELERAERVIRVAREAGSGAL